MICKRHDAKVVGPRRCIVRCSKSAPRQDDEQHHNGKQVTDQFHDLGMMRKQRESNPDREKLTVGGVGWIAAAVVYDVTQKQSGPAGLCLPHPVVRMGPFSVYRTRAIVGKVLIVLSYGVFVKGILRGEYHA